MKIFGLKCSKSSIGICNNVVNNRSSSFDLNFANSNRSDDPVCSSVAPSSIVDLTTNTNGQVSNQSDGGSKNGNCGRQPKKLHASSSSDQLATSTSANCEGEKPPTLIVPKSAALVTMRDKKSTSTMTRVQKLKKRLSHSFGRLSISKENHDIIIPHNGYSDEFLDRFETIANMPDSKSSDAEYNHNKNNWNTGDWCDRVHRQLSVSSDSKLLDEDKQENKKVTMRSKQPPRPKSEVFLSQQQQQQQHQNNDNRRKRYSAFGGDSPYGKSENYIKFEPLGEGSYATVFKGYSILTNRIVALKEIRLLEQEGAPFTAIREASILKELKHANIVTLHDIVHTKETLTFVFEYLQTDLSHYLERHPYGLAYRNVKLFMFQLLRGLAYCHKHRVLHRDVKPQNLLISEIGELKLADFGLARVKSVPSHTYSHEVVTLWYRPPDVLLGSTEYSTSLDMWGVGCIFVEMIQGAAIFPGMKDVFSQLNKIFMRLGTPTEKTWPGVTSLPNYDTDQIYFYKPQDVKRNWPRLARLDYVCSLVESFLQLQPNKRISADNALRHPYFNSLPKKLLDLPNDEGAQSLVVKASEVKKKAYAPYSRFEVGAAITFRDSERTFTGCNVENASFGLTNCAERTAVFKAVSEGFAQHPIERLALIASDGDFTTPCGACLQVLSEFTGSAAAVATATAATATATTNSDGDGDGDRDRDGDFDVFVSDPQMNNVLVTKFQALFPKPPFPDKSKLMH